MRIRLSNKIFFLIGILIASGGLFFIRNDWPFGFDGAYLAVAGVLGLLFIIVLRMFYVCAMPRPGLCGAFFFAWVFITMFNLFIVGIISEQIDAATFLFREMVLVLLIFMVGFSSVKWLDISPHTVLLVSSIWVLVASVPFFESLLLAGDIRRIKVLASVNYMAASFTAFAVFASGTLLFIKNHSIIKICYLYLILMLSLTGLFFSGARSAFLALFLVLFFWLIRFLVMTLISGKFSKATLSIVFSGMLFGIVCICFSFYMFLTLDLSRLLMRFDLSAIKDAFDYRLTRHFLASIPVTLPEAVFGKPGAYALFSSGTENPHNLFIAALRFGGIASLLTLVFFFMLTVFYFVRVMVKSAIKEEKNILLILFSFFFVLVVYSMLSGHFTRHWHLYWVAGLLSGYLELLDTSIKTKKQGATRIEHVP